MWQLENRTPFAADRAFIRDMDGAEVWIVAVKATYDITPDGATQLSKSQVPVHTGPVLHDGLKSLRYDTDLGPRKRNTDIVLIGHAYSQDGSDVSELWVAWRVGSIKRTARVISDRFWDSDASGDVMSTPIRFASMPLVFERAFGGRTDQDEHDLVNPVGKGSGLDGQGRVALPNIESVEQPIRAREDRPPVVTFGPIASHWPERRKFAGTYDDQWREERCPLLPQDLDPRFWQCAPASQQAQGYLVGGELVELINLTKPGFSPNGRVRFEVPDVNVVFETHFYDQSVVRSQSVVHTLVLEPDYPRISVVHHMMLPCHPKVNLLSHTVISERVGIKGFVGKQSSNVHDSERPRATEGADV